MLAQIVLFDGFDLLDVVGPFEVLAAGSALAGGGLRVELVSAEGARSVPSGIGGVPLPASAAIDPRRADLIIVPGAAGEIQGDGPNTIPALLGRALETPLGPALRQAAASPALTLVTVCGGSLLLAMAGLLAGRPAVTHHMGMPALAAAGAQPIAARIVDDGTLISGGGVTSGLDVGLYLLERTLGPQVAVAVEALFEWERRGTVWKPSKIAA